MVVARRPDARKGALITCILAGLCLPSLAAADDESKAAVTPSVTLKGSSEAEQSHQQAVEELHGQLNAIWAGATLKRGTTAVYVVDADTGEELYRVHDSTPMNPASNVKLVSTGTVLSTLGPDWTFKTRLLGAGPDAEGTVHGGLYLYGDYDPTIGPGALQSLAAKLAEDGVRRVEGDILLSDDATRDTLARSRVRVTVTGRAHDKPLVEVYPASDFVQVVSNKVRSRKRGRSRVRVHSSLKEIEDGAAVLQLSLKGTIRPGHKRVVTAATHRPSTFTGATLKRALEDAGIVVSGEIRLASFEDFNNESSAAGLVPFPLATHESPSIASLVARVNKRSLNSLSDRLVMSAARSVHGGPLSMEKAVELMKSWLTSIGVDASSVVLDTGSGLSYQTKLSTHQIVKVLRAAGGYASPSLPSASATTFRKSLAIGGIDGTLRRRFRTEGSTLDGRVRGKTGTLTSVIALSGFLKREDGRTLCFSIVTNGHLNRRKRNVRLEHEHMVAKLDLYLGQTAENADEELAANTELAGQPRGTGRFSEHAAAEPALQVPLGLAPIGLPNFSNPYVPGLPLDYPNYSSSP